MERKLESWEASEEETAQICDRLEELGLLDDQRYACTVVRHYSGKGYGVRKLQDELYRPGSAPGDVGPGPGRGSGSYKCH